VDILDDMEVSKLSANFFFLKVNYSFNCNLSFRSASVQALNPVSGTQSMFENSNCFCCSVYFSEKGQRQTGESMIKKRKLIMR